MYEIRTDNYKFLEEYKRLDALCNDIFGVKDGVSEYIRQMNATPLEFRVYDDWEGCHGRLIRLRHLRNKLVHEPGAFDEVYCTDRDMAWLHFFRNQLLQRADPLVLAAAEQKRREKFARQSAPRKQTAAQKVKVFFRNLAERFKALFKK